MKITELLPKIKEVYAAKLPEESYGIYWNETSSTKEGRDLTIGWFFDKWAWMGEDTGFEKLFDEVQGEGAWMKWLDDWTAATEGSEIEFGEYHADLSGHSSMINAVERR